MPSLAALTCLISCGWSSPQDRGHPRFRRLTIPGPAYPCLSRPFRTTRRHASPGQTSRAAPRLTTFAYLISGRRRSLPDRSRSFGFDALLSRTHPGRTLPSLAAPIPTALGLVDLSHQQPAVTRLDRSCSPGFESRSNRTLPRPTLPSHTTRCHAWRRQSEPGWVAYLISRRRHSAGPGFPPVSTPNETLPCRTPPDLSPLCLTRPDFTMPGFIDPPRPAHASWAEGYLFGELSQSYPCASGQPGGNDIGHIAFVGWRAYSCLVCLKRYGRRGTLQG